jgi:branched-chain amino acid transport system ATP-binding protein
MLQLEGVSVRYGMIQAVAGVDLQVAPGEWVAVIGANGAGKTSLLRGVMGLAQTSGKILWQGMRLDRLPP